MFESNVGSCIVHYHCRFSALSGLITGLVLSVGALSGSTSSLPLTLFTLIMFWIIHSVGLSYSLNKLSTKNRGNGTETHSLNSRLGFGPANKVNPRHSTEMLKSATCFPVPLGTPHKLSKLRVARPSIIMNWIMSFEILAHFNISHKFSSVWAGPYTRANGAEQIHIKS